MVLPLADDRIVERATLLTMASGVPQNSAAVSDLRHASSLVNSFFTFAEPMFSARPLAAYRFTEFQALPVRQLSRWLTTQDNMSATRAWATLTFICIGRLIQSVKSVGLSPMVSVILKALIGICNIAVLASGEPARATRICRLPSTELPTGW